MGVFQDLYETYENNKEIVGILQQVGDQKRVPLAPVSHMLQKASITITIDSEGNFLDANSISSKDPWAHTVIPATERSCCNRTSGIAPHPLAEQLKYLSPDASQEKFRTAYLTLLNNWNKSEYCHPKACAVYKYVEKGTINRDLAEKGLVKLTDAGELDPKGKLEMNNYMKCLVRWRVENVNEVPNCWEDKSLYQSWIDYYNAAELSKEDRLRGLCMITGQYDVLTYNHPKGIFPGYANAKLISAQDDSDEFVFKGGIVKTPQQAIAITYEASQKIHSAAIWLTRNFGVTIGGKTYVCWTPSGNPVPNPLHPLFHFEEGKSLPAKETDYKEVLRFTIKKYSNDLPENENVVVLALDNSTKGRGIYTYYQKLKASEFFANIEKWYKTVCWPNGILGISSPSIREIATFAFGTERKDKKNDKNNKVVAEDKAIHQHIQILEKCMVEDTPIPSYILNAITTKMSRPMSYSSKNWRKLRFIACCLLHRYHAERFEQSLDEKEWSIELMQDNNDRSYLFGRLLAICEKVETDTYTKGQDDNRTPSAIRYWTMYLQNPEDYAAKIIANLNTCYMRKLSHSRQSYYKTLIQEIYEQLNDYSAQERHKPLESSYMMGYQAERNELYKKKEAAESNDELKNISEIADAS